MCLVQRIYWLVTSDMPYCQHAWGTPIAGNKVLCTCRGDLDFPNIFRATVPVHESTYCCHRGSVQNRSRVPMRYKLRLNGDLVIVVLLFPRTVKETSTPPSRHGYRTVEPYVNSCIKNCNTKVRPHQRRKRCSGSTSASVFLLPPSASPRPSRSTSKDRSRGKSRLFTVCNTKAWLPSAWKHSHIRVLSHSSRFWPTLRNGCSTISSQAHCGKERHISSISWFWRCSFATRERATQILAASRVTGTKTSKPRMLVHVWRQRRLHGSVIAGNARCQSRHVLTIARSASGRH
jgi:hypothetical protein